jgi:hypothetical protein
LKYLYGSKEKISANEILDEHETNSKEFMSNFHIVKLKNTFHNNFGDVTIFDSIEEEESKGSPRIS